MNIGSFLGRFKLIMYLTVFAGLFSASMALAQVQNTPGQNAQNIANQLCSVVALVADIVGVLAILMFVLGGVLYAFAHFLPAAGNIKGSMQGWGMGILMGGIIMLLLYILAPFIVSKIINASAGGVIPQIANVACSSSGQANIGSASGGALNPCASGSCSAVT